MIATENIDDLDSEQLNSAVRKLMAQVQFNQATIEKLTHEMAVLKRLKFAAKSGAFSAIRRA